jgi:hypothetical protein
VNQVNFVVPNRSNYVSALALVSEKIILRDEVVVSKEEVNLEIAWDVGDQCLLRHKVEVVNSEALKGRMFGGDLGDEYCRYPVA